MLFNSSIFLFIFLPLALLGWYQIKSLKGRLIFLTVVSCFFYGYWDYRFVALMLFSICFDYFCGNKIHALTESNNLSARYWVAASIIINLAILGFFKYFNFFIDTAEAVWPGGFTSRVRLDIILPVGISFYIFESMTYSIDIYRRIAKPAASFFHLSAYISMFPRLNAGPIVRYSQIEDQLRDISDRINYNNLARGLFVFTLGLSRKIFIADFFAEWADKFFDGGIERQFFVSWAGTLSYAFQIYFDFSAYCEMAFGLGIMLGFEFPKNFNSPYKAKSFSDFWRRWHIALSEFLRDYLYIPLGGNRRSVIKVNKNLMITMLLGGLWHGASWMFIIWGGLHGFYLVMEKFLNRFFDPSKFRLYGVVVFIAVCLAWIFFRSTSLEFAIHTFKSCLMLNGFESRGEMYNTIAGLEVPEYFRVMGGIKNILALVAVFIFAKLAPNVFEIGFKASRLQLAVMVVLFFLCILNIEKPSPFIYFQF
jgi:alginate O-acetyltransferase complex protein AlgI